MNLHLAQSVQARNELARIANVKYQIIAAKDSNPVIGCTQDAVSGVYLLSTDKKIPGHLVADMLCTTNSETQYDIDTKKSYTGLEVFSHLIPKGITFKKGDVNVKNGEVLSGTLKKALVSTKKNSIIHYIWDKYGPIETQDFIDNTQRLILNYLYKKGISIGFGDCVPSKDIFEKIQQLIYTQILSTNNQITVYENNSNYSKDIFESEIASELNTVQDSVGKMIKDVMDKMNGFFILAESGGKGSHKEMAQISGCIGQVNQDGARLKKRVNGRVLPIFHQNDDTPEARGFVKSSLLTGQDVYETYFTSMAGRDGLIDTALKTADTGYVQRKIVKCLEDIIIKYDGLVKSANGKIIQYVYGENGYDQVKQTSIKLNIINMNDGEIEDTFGFKHSKFNSDKFVKKIKQMRDNLRQIYFTSVGSEKVMEDSFNSIVNFERIVNEYSNNKENKSIDPNYIMENIKEIMNDFDNRVFVLNNGRSKLIAEDEMKHKYIYKVALYEYLAPKKVLYNYGLSKEEFDNLVKDIKLSYSRGLVEPGELVGVIAGQSLGEPTSQMTLNTKHHAGAGASGGANEGVPRIKELLNFSKDIKTPQMHIYIDDKFNTNQKVVNNIASYLKFITINELIDNAEIIYDKMDNSELSKTLKNDNTTTPFFINNEKEEIKNMPFVFRLKMNIEKMMDKETSLLDIKTKFISYWYKNFSNTKDIKKKNIKEIISYVDKLAIMANNDNIIHIRFKLTNFTTSILINFLKIVLNTITLKGINGIDNISINGNERRMVFSKDGTVSADKEFKIVTAGINVEKLNYIKGINQMRTRINDVRTAYQYYGIEAARKILFDEFSFAFRSSNINVTHLYLLIDYMTHIGEVVTIDRHGVNKVNVDVLTKASFEKQMEYFTDACLYNEVDPLNTVVSRIITGRCIPGGTGAFDLILDTEMIKNSEYIDDETGGRTTFNPLQKESIFEDVINFGLNDRNFLIPTN